MQHVRGMEFVHNSEDHTTCKDYSVFLPVNARIGDCSAVGNMTSCNYKLTNMCGQDLWHWVKSMLFHSCLAVAMELDVMQHIRGMEVTQTYEIQSTCKDYSALPANSVG